MKCQSCSNQATFHVTDIVGGAKHEVHLCEQCAEKQQLTKPGGFDLSALVQSFVAQHVGPESEELARLTCPACGIKYMEFRAEGRLGCPHDYEAFRVGLEPILQRIHRQIRHQGKRPQRASALARMQSEISELRTQLRSAVDNEKYEEAARLRDLIRQKEATDEPG